MSTSGISSSFSSSSFITRAVEEIYVLLSFQSLSFENAMGCFGCKQFSSFAPAKLFLDKFVTFWDNSIYLNHIQICAILEFGDPNVREFAY